MSYKFNKITLGTPYLGLMGKVWGVCCEFEVWFMFCCCHRSVQGNTLINWTCYNSTQLYILVTWVKHVHFIYLQVKMSTDKLMFRYDISKFELMSWWLDTTFYIWLIHFAFWLNEFKNKLIKYV